MSYHVTLEAFEGPLDLLLNLIQKHKIDIYDIPIAKITDQFLEYINGMQNLDIDIASEFLVMAATLLQIKVKMLLPKNKSEDLDEEQEMEEEDPRQDLVNKLLEYQKFKEISQWFREKEEQQTNIYYRDIDEFFYSDIFQQKVNPLENIDVSILYKHFKKILQKTNEEDKPIYKVTRKEITISGQMKNILSRLKLEAAQIAFSSIISDSVSKLEIVINFLAVLELIKQKKIMIQQNNNFEPINICLLNPIGRDE